MGNFEGTDGKASRFGGRLTKPVRFVLDGEWVEWRAGTFVEIVAANPVHTNGSLARDVVFLRGNVEVRLRLESWSAVEKLLTTGFGDAGNRHLWDKEPKAGKSTLRLGEHAHVVG